MDPSPLPFAALMLFGFVLAAAGHLYKSSLMIGAGLLLIFLATALLQLSLSRSG